MDSKINQTVLLKILNLFFGPEIFNTCESGWLNVGLYDPVIQLPFMGFDSASLAPFGLFVGNGGRPIELYVGNNLSAHGKRVSYSAPTISRPPTSCTTIPEIYLPLGELHGNFPFSATPV